MADGGKAHYIEIWREVPEETPKRFEAGTFQERDLWQVWGVQRTTSPPSSSSLVVLDTVYNFSIIHVTLRSLSDRNLNLLLSPAALPASPIPEMVIFLMEIKDSPIVNKSISSTHNY